MTTARSAARRISPGAGRVPAPRPAATRPGNARPARARHRSDIEGLRAVAVLLVVLYHCGMPLFGGGYVGVDVFFVISGFLITGLLHRELATTGTVSITRFYARRSLRLLPAATLVTVVTVAAAYRWLPPLRTPGIAADGFWTAIYGINYRLAAVGTDYLNADAAPSPLQHFWSLAVEEQFYLVWPPLLLGTALLATRARVRPARAIGLALATIVTASLAVSIWQTHANSQWAYFGLHSRAWELGIGALLALAPGVLPRRAAAILSAAGLLAIVTAALVFTPETPFPGYAALLPVLGTAAVLAGGASSPTPLLSTRPLRAIGRLSYSWYLWHWPALMIVPYALGRHPGVPGNLVIAIAALLLAMLTFALVENPARYLRALRRPPSRAIVAGLLVTVLTASVFATTAHTRRTVSGGSPAPVLTAADLTPKRLSATLTASLATAAVPENLTPPLDRAALDRPRIYDEDCSSRFADATIRKPCTYGDTASATTIVLFGDSHAGQWFPALESLARQRHWKLVVVTKTACSAASVRIYQTTLKRPFDECVRWRESAWVYLASLRPAMIVLASAAGGGNLVPRSTTPDDVWAAGWIRTVNSLAPAGARLYLIEDTPYQAGDTPECLSTHPDEPRACIVSAGDAFPRTARRLRVDAALRARGVTLVDPAPWFCTPSGCPVIVGNVLVYRDAGHITATYINLLAPLLGARLSPAPGR